MQSPPVTESNSNTHPLESWRLAFTYLWQKVQICFACHRGTRLVGYSSFSNVRNTKEQLGTFMLITDISTNEINLYRMWPTLLRLHTIASSNTIYSNVPTNVVVAVTDGKWIKWEITRYRNGQTNQFWCFFLHIRGRNITLGRRNRNFHL